MSSSLCNRQQALLYLMQDLKDEGNTLFKELKYDVAWMHYRNALFIARILETRFYHEVEKEFISTLFSNRAFCCLKKVGIIFLHDLCFVNVLWSFLPKTMEPVTPFLLCRLRSIAAHRDHFVRRLSVCPSVRLSGSHTFLVVRHSYVSQATHTFLGMLPLCFYY